MLKGIGYVVKGRNLVILALLVTNRDMYMCFLVLTIVHGARVNKTKGKQKVNKM